MPFKVSQQDDFLQNSTVIYPGEMHFFFVKTLWNTLCPLVSPTDCQAGVQVVQVCIQPLPKPGLDKAIEQLKAVTPTQ